MAKKDSKETTAKTRKTRTSRTKKSVPKDAKKTSPRDTLKGATSYAKGERPSLWSRVKVFFRNIWRKLHNPNRVRLHKSFKRSYREDYTREIEVPGITYHAMKTFKLIFKNWKLFLPLLVLSAVLAVLLIGLMNENTFKQFQSVLDETTKQMGYENVGYLARASLLLLATITTGGLTTTAKDTDAVFIVIILLIIWLATVYILRHRLAGHKLKLRDALYNSMTPLLSTFAVFAIAILQCIPIFILIIVHSAAVQTDFLATPFYALMYFIFAAVMITLSSYLLSSTLIALVAVTAPGLYPMQAIHTASDLMMGRRIKFIIRVIAMLVTLVIIWVMVMIPLITFDLLMKNFEWAAGIPFVPICLLVMTCFTGIYISTYLYLYYRWMLDYDEK